MRPLPDKSSPTSAPTLEALTLLDLLRTNQAALSILLAERIFTNDIEESEANFTATFNSSDALHRTSLPSARSVILEEAISVVAEDEDENKTSANAASRGDPSGSGSGQQ
jgi:hypothetical protein